MAQRVKNLPTMQKTGVQPLGREDPLEKKMATHSNSMDRGGWWATVHGVVKSWTRMSDSHIYTHTHRHTRRWEETGLEREGSLRGSPSAERSPSLAGGWLRWGLLWGWGYQEWGKCGHPTHPDQWGLKRCLYS